MPNRPDISTAPSAPPDYHIGEELRARRIARGETPEQIAKALKIRTSYINAIEQLEPSALPSIGYALGYVRGYAAYVGLDGAQAVARYKTDSAVPEDLGRRKMPHFVPKTKVRLPRGLLSALTVLGCAGVLTIWYAGSVPTEAAPEALSEVLDEAAYAPPSLPEDPSILTLKAVAPSWVQVTDATGRPVMSRIMVTGETWSTDKERLTLSARDGAAIELYQGRERLGAFGEKGVAFTGKPLSASTVLPAPEDTPLEATPLEDMTPISTE